MLPAPPPSIFRARLFAYFRVPPEKGMKKLREIMLWNLRRYLVRKLLFPVRMLARVTRLFPSTGFLFPYMERVPSRLTDSLHVWYLREVGRRRDIAQRRWQSYCTDYPRLTPEQRSVKSALEARYDWQSEFYDRVLAMRNCSY